MQKLYSINVLLNGIMSYEESLIKQSLFTFYFFITWQLIYRSIYYIYEDKTLLPSRS